MGNRKKPNASRREFLKYTGLTAMAVAMDLTPPLLRISQSGLIASAEPLDKITIPGKNGLRVLRI